MTQVKQNTSSELLKEIETGIYNVLTSNKFKDFLTVQSKFHKYSFNNVALIYMQKPDATKIAGYQTWKKVNRQVNKGEKGISILAPVPFKFKKNVNETCNGKIEQKEIEVEGIKFKKVSVFDISQTSGKELPKLCEELKTASENSRDIINAIKNICKIPIVENELSTGAKGVYSRKYNTITIKPNMSLDQTVKTILHEFAHSKLHCNKTNFTRAECEIQAESIAFIVSKNYNIDTSDYTFEYLSAWSKDSELNDLKKSFNLIQKTANEIITDLDEELKTLKLDKNIQNEKIKVEIEWSESISLKQGKTYSLSEVDSIISKATTAINLTKQKTPEYVQYEKVKAIVNVDNEKYIVRFDIGDDVYSLTQYLEKAFNINTQDYKELNIDGKMMMVKDIKKEHEKLGLELEKNFNNDDFKKFEKFNKTLNELKDYEVKENIKSTKQIENLNRNFEIEY